MIQRELYNSPLAVAADVVGPNKTQGNGLVTVVVDCALVKY